MQARLSGQARLRHVDIFNRREVKLEPPFSLSPSSPLWVLTRAGDAEGVARPSADPICARCISARRPRAAVSGAAGMSSA